MLGDRISRLNSREKLGLIIAMLVTAVLVLDRLAVRPLGVRCEGLDLDIQREAKTLEYQASVMQARSEVERQFESIRAQLGEELPAAEAIDAMKGEIDALARASEVSLLAMKHREPRRTEFYDEYALDIGDFETDEIGLMRFLHALMEKPGTFHVTKLKLAPDATGKRVKGSMTVTKVAIPTRAAAAPQG